MVSQEISVFVTDFKKIKEHHSLKNFDEIVAILFRSRLVSKTKLISELELIQCLGSKEKTQKSLKKLRILLRKTLPINAKAKFKELCTEDDGFIVDRIKESDKFCQVQTLQNSVKSGVLVLFLKKLMEKRIEKDLYNSLDFNSLVRLSMISGGKTIDIPTYDDVERLLGSAYYSYMVLIEGLDKHVAYGKVKEELGIVVDKQLISEDLSKLTLLFASEINDANSDMYTMFKNLIKLIKTFQEKLELKLEKVKGDAQLLEIYNDMNVSFLTLTKALYKISK